MDRHPSAPQRFEWRGGRATRASPARQLCASDRPARAVPSGFQRVLFRMGTRNPFIHAVPDRLPKLRVAGSSPVPRSQKSPGKPGLFFCRSRSVKNAVPHIVRPREVSDETGSPPARSIAGAMRDEAASGALRFRPAQEQPYDGAGDEELHTDRHTSGPVPAGDTMGRVELLPAQFR